MQVNADIIDTLISIVSLDKSIIIKCQSKEPDECKDTLGHYISTTIPDVQDGVFYFLAEFAKNGMHFVVEKTLSKEDANHSSVLEDLYFVHTLEKIIKIFNDFLEYEFPLEFIDNINKASIITDDAETIVALLRVKAQYYQMQSFIESYKSHTITIIEECKKIVRNKEKKEVDHQSRIEQLQFSAKKLFEEASRIYNEKQCIILRALCENSAEKSKEEIVSKYIKDAIEIIPNKIDVEGILSSSKVISLFDKIK